MTSLSPRQARLLKLLQAKGGGFSTGDVHDINRTIGAPKRATARHDVDLLRRSGLLTTDDDLHHLTGRGQA